MFELKHIFDDDFCSRFIAFQKFHDTKSKFFKPLEAVRPSLRVKLERNHQTLRDKKSPQ